ncbi:hypothetical protein Adt_36796 [Abeliophyllum distichum]|uniref:Uncharacterized protein n=1 Tax=Abeliophyllum distichum TaxID=126358 RepID=A0ABD1QIM3_9LAMI
MEQRFSQGPLPLGLGHLPAGSSQRYAQGPLPLRLGYLLACSFHGATLRTRASPIGTRSPSNLLLPWSNASYKGLSHLDSATFQLAPPMEQRFAQGPLPLGLSHLAACSLYRATLHSKYLPYWNFAYNKKQGRRPYKCPSRTL